MSEPMSRAEKAQHDLKTAEMVLENLRVQLRAAIATGEFYYILETQTHNGKFPWQRIFNFAVIVEGKLEWVVPDPTPHPSRGVEAPEGWRHLPDDYDKAYKQLNYSKGPGFRMDGGSLTEVWYWVVEMAKLPPDEEKLAKKLKDVRMRRMGG